MANKRLNIGVIGAGGRGGLADQAHRPAEGIHVMAGADLNPQALADFRTRYGADAFVTHDYRKLLERQEIGAVFVTSPDFLHEEHAVAALEARKAVYLEKPMAISIEGCDRILRTAQACKGKLYLGHNMRHSAVIVKMKELIDAGAIGEVKVGWCRHFIAYGGDAYFKDWHADRTKSTSLLLQKGAHDIDVLHWLCGAYTRKVTAMGGLTLYHQIQDRHAPAERGNASWSLANWPPLSQKGLNPVLDVEDVSMMLMEMERGIFATYLQCHYTPDAWRNYTIIGSAGRVENFGDKPGHSVVRLWNKRSSYKPEGDQEFVIPEEKGGHGGADPRIVAEFISHVLEGGPARTSPVAARNSVAAGFMAAASLRQGSVPLEIPKLADDVKAYFDA